MMDVPQNRFTYAICDLRLNSFAFLLAGQIDCSFIS